MKRQRFISVLLLAIPALSFAKTGSFKFGKRPKKGFVVRSNESRFDGKQKTVENVLGRCIVSSADTDGDLLIVAPSKKTFAFKGGPPLHIHKNQDEIFFVANGEFIVQIDKEIVTVKTGDTVFIPRGIPHTYANPIENNPGILISIHQPAGKNEAFFNYLCTYEKLPDYEIDPDSPVVGEPIKIE
ncbi:cupin domain-containing protein [Flavobacterium sp. WW92]|jgi:Mannose-6-phosphate isomerase|uniref:cupin domain-containing protein n=1 Tax=unclassified Flavobacterium TaxID=196869 RepID=UPI002225632A|nr:MULTISPECIES: cupin domain-containing protein [unclassified Flavobacterium]WDO12847.1 cupin domain-containing protein [Flavobacterium sp. WW92]